MATEKFEEHWLKRVYLLVTLEYCSAYVRLTLKILFIEEWKIEGRKLASCLLLCVPMNTFTHSSDQAKIVVLGSYVASTMLLTFCIVCTSMLTTSFTPF